MKLILAANMNAAKEFCAKYTSNVSEEAAIIVQSIKTIEGLRFRYEDVVRVPGWSKRDDIEEIEDRILRTHVVLSVNRFVVPMSQEEIESRETFRADSESICPGCNRSYWSHPRVDPDNNPTLRATCDGELVKL